MTRKMNRLLKWWNQHHETSTDDFIGKLEEYGAGDLYAIGRTMAKVANIEEPDDATAFELGCLFYVVGKIERLVSGHSNGQTPSADSWHDIAIYAKMVLAQRDGVWPA